MQISPDVQDAHDVMYYVLDDCFRWMRIRAYLLTIFIIIVTELAPIFKFGAIGSFSTYILWD